MNEVIFVFCDDWQAIYINGELKIEGHEITAWDALKLNLQWSTLKEVEVDQEWAEIDGFPERYNEIPKSAIIEDILVHEIVDGNILCITTKKI